MHIKSRLLLLTLFLAVTMSANAQKRFSVTSPDGRLTATVSCGPQCDASWEIVHDNTQVLLSSAINACIDEAEIFHHVAGKIVRRQQVRQTFDTPFYQKAQVADNYNTMTIRFPRGFSLEVRAYDDGAAYRILVERGGQHTVFWERPDFIFHRNDTAYIPYVNDQREGEKYSYSFESYYDRQPLSQMFSDSLAITPLAVCLADGKKAVVMDCGVEDYPGMMLSKSNSSPGGLSADFAPNVLEQTAPGGGRNLVATRRADYIARFNGPRSLPWRAVVVTTNDKQLLDCDMAMRLAPTCRIGDTSWIKPGKVAWDWWNNTNIWGVDFQSGMNTATYQHYIDFAQQNHLEYIIIDDGWSGQESLTDNLNPDIDIPTLVSYAQQRGVGIILWSSWRNIIGNEPANPMPAMERYMSHYQQLGIKGFKVDFFDRDDQQCIVSVWQMAECAARHHLLLDMHGLKPMGVQRAYPNVLNFEGVKGLENMKWEQRNDQGPIHDQPAYDVTIPYLRMLCGPLDYTPGAMDNAMRDNFFGSYYHPMSQGTRAHQVAMYVMFFAPLQMLADSPTKYRREQPTTDFISQIPTTFDETVPLTGALGEYVAVARRKGDTWYVGAMTNWTSRMLTLDLSFLNNGTHQAVIFADGPNTINEKEAMDYQLVHRNVTSADRITVSLAPGGGWAAIIH